MGVTAMLERFARAVRFDASFYREARDNPRLNWEALAVVIGVVVISSFGVAWRGMPTVVGTALIGVIGYYNWCYVAQWVAKKVYSVRADVGQIKRGIGYAYLPQLLSIVGLFGVLPWLGEIGNALGWLWSFALGVFSMQVTMQITTKQSIVVTALGWLTNVVCLVLLRLLLG